jgi:hypothetical protein
MIRSFYLAALIPFSLGASGQISLHEITPIQTDSLITGNSVLHQARVSAEGGSLNKLMLFLPGTNASPQDYELFQETAAELGYHSIGLSYENVFSINLQVCPGTTDPTCHGRARREIWLGSDLHDSIEVDYPNSILNRLIRLLAYLDINHPSENWGQFLSEDAEINWNATVIAGHSQGAGHAAMGSKLFGMNRVIMFSWIDWIQPGMNPAWITSAGQTADSAYFGFIHTGDASIYNGIPTTWSNLGMEPFGQITSVDEVDSPYGNSHSLITSAPIDAPPTEPNYHNAPVVDWMTTYTPEGDILYKPVWKYLLGFPEQVLAVGEEERQTDFELLPNPAFDEVRVVLSEGTADLIEVFNLSGKCILRARHVDRIDVRSLKTGLFLVRVSSGENFRVTKMVKL